MVRSTKIYGALSADIVDSTSLPVYELKQMQEEMQIVLHKIEDTSRHLWWRIVRGDTVECLTEYPGSILRVALALKCYMKYWFSASGASAESKEFVLRYSIGIGTMRYFREGDNFIDGPAIYLSGRNLDSMRDGSYAAFDCDTKNDDFVNLLDLSLNLVDSIVNEMSAKQAIVIYYKILGAPEKIIARELGLSQPAINLRANLGGWNRIKKSLSVFENLNYENYVC